MSGWSCTAPAPAPGSFLVPLIRPLVSSGTPLPPPSAPRPPVSFVSKALPKSSHFPLSLVPPASALASCCSLPPAICSPGSHKDIFKTANHILSLSKLACGSSTSEQNPRSSPQPPRRPGPCDLPPVSLSIFPGSPVPATATSARFLQHGQLVPAPGSLHLLFSPPPRPSQLAPSYTSCLNCVNSLGKPSPTITPSCN